MCWILLELFIIKECLLLFVLILASLISLSAGISISSRKLGMVASIRMLLPKYTIPSSLLRTPLPVTCIYLVLKSSLRYEVERMVLLYQMNIRYVSVPLEDQLVSYQCLMLNCWFDFGPWRTFQNWRKYSK